MEDVDGGLVGVLVLGECLPGRQCDHSLAEYVLVTLDGARGAPLDDAPAAASSLRASASRQDFCTALTDPFPAAAIRSSSGACGRPKLGSRHATC
jgi:hypothetical protein